MRKYTKIIKLSNGGELRIRHNGYKTWWLNDKRHREDGPAVQYTDGDKEYYIHGSLHRIDGPARDYTADGDGDSEWWINGEHIPCTTQKEFEQLMKLKAFW